MSRSNKIVSSNLISNVNGLTYRDSWLTDRPLWPIWPIDPRAINQLSALQLIPIVKVCCFYWFYLKQRMKLSSCRPSLLYTIYNVFSPLAHSQGHCNNTVLLAVLFNPVPLDVCTAAGESFTTYNEYRSRQKWRTLLGQIYLCKLISGSIKTAGDDTSK